MTKKIKSRVDKKLKKSMIKALTKVDLNKNESLFKTFTSEFNFSKVKKTLNQSKFVSHFAQVIFTSNFLIASKCHKENLKINVFDVIYV